MLNALFYTFSTIAQTLAGAIALLSAFLLYRLQSLNSEIDSHSMSLRKACTGRGQAQADKAFDLHHRGKHQELIDFTEACFPQDRSGTVILSLEYLSAAVKLRASLFRRFHWALWLTAGLIVGSVIVLAVAPAVEDCTLAAVALFIVGIAWLALCIGSYVLLILRSLH
jgi:hypothetical protein